MNKFVGLLVFIIVSLSLALTSVHAQEWYTANQITITWDAVTEGTCGATFPEDNIIEYRLYLSNAITDPDKTNPVEIGVVTECVYTITLNTEGKYFVGLQTIRKLANGDLIGESVIGWTDDPVIAANGAIFGLQHFVPPLPPCGVGIYD